MLFNVSNSQANTVSAHNLLLKRAEPQKRNVMELKKSAVDRDLQKTLSKYIRDKNYWNEQG